MERLTIRNSDGSVSQPMDLKWAEALEKLAAYEDAEEQGRMVRLPCKIGDILYTVKDGAVYETPIISYHSYEWTQGFRMRLLFDSRRTNGSYDFPITEYGKTIFQTREEAEAALKGEKEDV